MSAILSTHNRVLSSRVFRLLAKGPAVSFEVRGDHWTAEPGDWIDGEGVRLLDNKARNQLGRTANVSSLTPRLGYSPDEAQMVARPAGKTSAEKGGATLQTNPEDEGQIVLKPLGEAPDAEKATFLLGSGVECPLGVEHTAMLLSALAPEVDVVFPVTNLSMPCSIPMIGDPGSPYPRLPGGVSIWEVAERLLDGLQSAGRGVEVGSRPAQPMAAFVRAGAAERVADGTYSFALAPAVWLWEKDPKAPRGLSEAFGPSKGVLGPDWVETVSLAHHCAGKACPDRPPVALYSTSTGPWGGVGVLFRLADELQKLGAHAFVLHVKEVPHQYRPRTSPKKMRGASNIAPRWRKTFGPEATLVASHWGAGQRIAEIQRANPDVVTTTILQDREDLFEQPSWQQQISFEKVFKPFLEVGRGMAVSPWILSSMEAELGKDVSDYGVIVPGIDLSVFNPEAGQRRQPDEPIRIVAMWRPQTAKRRGMPLLRKTYDELNARFGKRISLELFGWNDKTSSEGRAPTYAKHHGSLSQAGVAALFASADIVVEPSLFQGLGLPGVEALACGACFVSTQNQGVDAYAFHEKNALVVPHEELPTAIARVIEDDALRERLMGDGPDSVAHLDWPLVGARWAIYLAELNLEQHPAGRYADAWRAIQDKAQALLA
ncbi:MAG: glycosyltransferase family 4 protein [Actinomycetales bacterium]|nr:glycosyltransferase family 4 protein [Actinomycetales bacterium]